MAWPEIKTNRKRGQSKLCATVASMLSYSIEVLSLLQWDLISAIGGLAPWDKSLQCSDLIVLYVDVVFRVIALK